MAHSNTPSSVVGDEDGGSWQRCQANREVDRQVQLLGEIFTGKSRDQRMPLGRFHRPKPERPSSGENLSLPK